MVGSLSSLSSRAPSHTSEIVLSDILPTRGSDPVFGMLSDMTVLGRGVLAVLTAVRLLQLVSWRLAMATADASWLARPWLAALAYGIAAVGTIVTLSRLWLIRRHPPVNWTGSLWWTDAVPAAVALVLGGLATAPGHGADYNHPTVALAIGTTATLALALPARQSLAAAGGLLVAYLAGITSTLAVGPVVLTGVAANAAALVGVPIGLVVLARTLGGADLRVTAAEEELAGARAALVAADRRESERSRQYRLLHDTVLSTLSALSRGTLQPEQPEVRQRLVADADYLRGLIATSGSAAGMRLVGDLAALRRDHTAAGLRIHQHLAEVPDALPEEVCVAISAAIREALNNVARHSGTTEAWVTITSGPVEQPGSVSVLVTDRGPPRGGPGWRTALRGSIWNG